MMADFEHFWERIQTLKKFELTALHYLKHTNGTFRCLNTNSLAGSEKDLDGVVAAALSHLEDTDKLSYSDRKYWEIYAAQSPPSMDVGATKTSAWRRRVVLAGLHLTVVGNNEIG